MPLPLCIFEDEHFTRLYPLTLTHPTFDLRCGILLLREKIARRFPDSRLHLFCRGYLAEVVREATPGVPVNQLPTEPCLFINGRFILGKKLPDAGSHDVVWKNNSEVAAAWLSGNRLSALAKIKDGLIPTAWFEGLPVEEIDGTFIRYSWDLVHHNPEQIKKDFAHFNRGGQILGKIYPNVTLLEEKNIYIAPGAKIKPGVVLDAEDGPIYIDEGATIMANASLQGPLFIGAKSAIKMGAKIYEGTSIGEVCKVGGEVEESIIHSYSNKQHEGFIGHSYLGQWVNIGADSNNSDLKNNYGTVKVYVNGEMVDSGSLFVGLTMGDHSKCGINTMFNTGTVVGVMSNVFGAGYPDKFIPSFTWGGIDKMETYEIDKALEVARRVMARRKLALSAAQEKMLKHVFEITASERKWQAL
ncbi:MAG: GlmU family protein [candidate division KSB1 bacterium]|nr:GlmU family protein [candidate division KSB1 bacterium]MDZ7303848.1 GlmU family protein [candidate division KSB1 bacterium]MDZ7312749.1 GlmU family protein [candidate division KSB1 bacterium]